ncbi:L-methionine gamma-lyase-like [Amphiura filiformis]|uniref:L-methionine gamma-lyase-like n=1 Tax=Amphiura filiformis TaxID=82378 RepID=UPI003B21BE13
MAEKQSNHVTGNLHDRRQEDERIFREGTSLDTLAVSSKPKLKGKEGQLGTPIIPSISVSAVHRFNEVDDFSKSLLDGYFYPRYGNHSCESAAHAINTLEGGAGALMFPSGMSACTTSLLAILKAGDHIIAPDPVYAGSYNFIKDFLPNYGVEITFVEACNMEAYRKAIKINTKVIYGETPTNPKLAVMDLAELAQITKEAPAGALSIVDSTFGTPYLQQPLKLGIDIAFHSCTKYLGGHSDLLGGCASCKDSDVLQKITRLYRQLGTCMSPFDAFLVLRGLRTLPVRMGKHCSNAMKIAQFLEQHPKITSVYYPGLPSHPQHEVAKKQMKDYGGMVVFEVAGGLNAAKTFVESVYLINLAVSLGGTESLIEHPASMTHGAWTGITDEERRSTGISDGLIRFSIGLEDADDLIADLTRALNKVQLPED